MNICYFIIKTCYELTDYGYDKDILPAMLKHKGNE